MEKRSPGSPSVFQQQMLGYPVRIGLDNYRPSVQDSINISVVRVRKSKICSAVSSTSDSVKYRNKKRTYDGKNEADGLTRLV